MHIVSSETVISISGTLHLGIAGNVISYHPIRSRSEMILRFENNLVSYASGELQVRVTIGHSCNPHSRYCYIFAKP